MKKKASDSTQRKDVSETEDLSSNELIKEMEVKEEYLEEFMK